MPPEYNETITSERKISDKKYEIDVLEDGEEKKTYTLVLEGGEWKIDQMGFMYYDKWKKSRQLFWRNDNLSSVNGGRLKSSKSFSDDLRLLWPRSNLLRSAHAARFEIIF